MNPPRINLNPLFGKIELSQGKIKIYETCLVFIENLNMKLRCNLFFEVLW